MNTKEACQLIEDGWKYETGEVSDGGKIFSKPKWNYVDGVKKLGMGIEPQRSGDITRKSLFSLNTRTLYIESIVCYIL